MSRKRLMSLLVALCMVITLLPMSVFASGVPTSGKAGEHVTWTMHDDGTLIFSGTGATLDNQEHVVQEWSEHHAQEVKHIVFEEGITYIGEWLFNTSLKYKRLESVTIPSTVTAIGEYAFTDLSGYLKKVYISDLEKWCAIDFRGNGATPFGCEADMYLNNELVETLVIPSSVSRIPSQSFMQCTSIKTLVIPDRVKEIGKLAFSSCDNLVKVVFQGDAPIVDGKLFINTKPFAYYPKTKSTWTETAIQAYDTDATWIPYDPATEDVVSDSYPGGESVGSIKWNYDEATKTLTFSGSRDMSNYDASLAFVPWRVYQNDAEKIVLEEGITSVGDYAFYEFQQVKEIVLPSTLKAIGDGAFKRCVNLETIVIPDGVTEIGINAFYYCAKLTSIKIPEGVTGINSSTFEQCSSLTEVTLPDGITFIGSFAFYYCALKDFEIPECVTLIGDHAFANSLNQSCAIAFPQALEIIGQSAFADCSGIEKLTFKGNAPTIGSGAFNWVTATAYYPGGNETWTAEVMQNYGGTITWIAHNHNYISTVTEPTCTEQGYTTHICSECGNKIIDTYTDALGHNVEQWTVTTEPGCTELGEKQGNCIRCNENQTDSISQVGHRWDNETLTIKTCAVCGALEGGYRITLDTSILGSATSVCVDGKDYPITQGEAGAFVLLTETNATNLVAYTFNDPNAADIHTQYPTGMKVWMLTFADGAYKATYVKEFDNLLQYSGSSIRITGTKGIRMITSIDKNTKKALTGKGLAGYTLEEYGTALAWASDLEGGNPLILGQSYTKSNFAYKKGKADPVFKDTGKLVQYTNVLVGFNNDQCIPDIAMRPYIILKDANGNLITIYGGTVYRNIGYIAYQNRSVFKSGTSSYKYVWDIIHHVYGNKYDSDYKG